MVTANRIPVPEPMAPMKNKQKCYMRKNSFNFGSCSYHLDLLDLSPWSIIFLLIPFFTPHFSKEQGLFFFLKQLQLIKTTDHIMTKNPKSSWWKFLKKVPKSFLKAVIDLTDKQSSVLSPRFPIHFLRNKQILRKFVSFFDKGQPFTTWKIGLLYI